MLEAEDIHLVIPVHNRKDYTLSCLESLRRQTLRGFHTIVVDDGSTDGTAESIASRFPEVTLLQGNGSLWWTAAMNMGVSRALEQGAAYIISLNDDVEAAEDYIEKMVAWASRHPRTLFGSFIFDITSHEPFSAGSRKNWWGYYPISLLDLLPADRRTGIHELTDASGRGLWIPAAAFRRVGLFDQKALPHYGADNDFTLRAARRGFPVFSNLDAHLYAHTEASGQLENTKVYSLRNWGRHLFGRKGAGNLWNFSVIAARHCPKTWLVPYWLCGVAGRTGGYLVNWVRCAIHGHDGKHP